jgi:hypothetical protein
MDATSSPSSSVARARALARMLEELASLVDRYRLLATHAAAAPGRARARQEAMRELAARSPGALRELDAVGASGIAERGRVVATLLDDLLSTVEKADALDRLHQPELAWARYAVELVPRLREVLRLKRRLAQDSARHPDADAKTTLAGVRTWYAQHAGERDPGFCRAPADTWVARVAVPPGGQAQNVAYEDAARALGVAVDAIKSALFPMASTAYEGEGVGESEDTDADADADTAATPKNAP